jgi:hypothetical protein
MKRLDLQVIGSVKRVVLALTAALIATLSNGLAAPAHAGTFSWSYSGTGTTNNLTDTGSGTLTTGGSASLCASPPMGNCSYNNPPYTTTLGSTITGITGTWNGFTIAGLVTPQSFAFNNNVLYLPPNQVFLDASANGEPGGLAFFVSNYTGNNVTTPTTVIVDLFFSTTSMEYSAVTGNTSGGCCSQQTVGDFTVPVGATPLPAALPLFATGLGGLGLLGWRRKRKARAS